MKKKYSESELNTAYLSLSDEQKKVLDKKIKRGMKTKWLNTWAKKKGIVLSDEDLSNPDNAMDNLLEWVLLDYEDHLKVDKNVRCECGRALRYRYTVLHKKTGVVYKLGKVHFQQHTGLSPEMVRLITKGIKEIDLERSEILTKIIDDWTMPFKIPSDFEIPKDMIDQINTNLPLLDRQETRLNKLILKHNYKHNNRINKNSNPLHQNKSTPKNIYKQLSFNQKSNSIYKTSITNKQVDQDNISLSNVEPVILYNKLVRKNIVASEVKELYLFIKNSRNELTNYGLTIDKISNAIMKALGYYNNKNIRRWLVEIQDLLGNAYY